MGNSLQNLTADAMDALVRYRWPGNVRELQNEVRRAALLSDGVILENHLSANVRQEPIDEEDAMPVERGTKDRKSVV